MKNFIFCSILITTTQMDAFETIIWHLEIGMSLSTAIHALFLMIMVTGSYSPRKYQVFILFYNGFTIVRSIVCPKSIVLQPKYDMNNYIDISQKTNDIEKFKNIIYSSPFIPDNFALDICLFSPHFWHDVNQQKIMICKCNSTIDIIPYYLRSALTSSIICFSL